MAVDVWQRTMDASRSSRYTVELVSALFDSKNRRLADALASEPALVVTTPTVHRLFGADLEHYLAAHRCHRVAVRVLACHEGAKGLHEVEQVCAWAAEAKLGRRSRVVSFGGGVCMDICGVAASLYRRGVPHVRIPTTLIGVIDAGVGVKSGINAGGKKSLLGSFHAPEACLLDSQFLSTLPARQVRCGLSESIKMGLLGSDKLFALLETHGARLASEALRPEDQALLAVIRQSVDGMLDELSANLFESSYARKVDFGHSFSPYIEESTNYAVAHGEAVAIDMAISTYLAAERGLMSGADRERVLRLLEQVGLPVSRDGIDASALHDSLRAVASHRAGDLNLVVPTKVGACTFMRRLDELSRDDLAQALEALSKRAPRRGAQ